MPHCEDADGNSSGIGMHLIKYSFNKTYIKITHQCDILYDLTSKLNAIKLTSNSRKHVLCQIVPRDL